MEVLAKAAACGQALDPAALLAAIPFCRVMGVTAERRGGQIVLILPFAEQLIGNVVLPALHGGAIGALLEITAQTQVALQLMAPRLPKTVDITIDYLRSGRAVTSYASARIAKQGKRTVNVHAQMWQDDEAKPIAALRGHMLLPSAGKPGAG